MQPNQAGVASEHTTGVPPAVIPVVLFAYARPTHMARVLACLRENSVPLICAYADGAKGFADSAAVAEVRALLRAIDWCEVRLVERTENLGLGRNVLAGVTEVAARHEAFIVWEDDLICVPGAYAWICAALRNYRDDERVMSVTGWTHPRVTPDGIAGMPYFDGRGEGWVWGTWARSWWGMNEPALGKQASARRRGVAPDAYGSDLPALAAVEQAKNIWAVRWFYHHLQHRGLCVRPPWSMVEHIGFDSLATNAAGAEEEWQNPPLQTVPAVPAPWPDPKENPQCSGLWRQAVPGAFRQHWRALKRRLARWFPL